MAIFPKRSDVGKCIWRVKRLGQVCSLQFIEETCTAIVTVRNNAFAFENHLFRNQDLWKIQQVEIEGETDNKTWLITKRYNWNCFKQDLPHLISDWIGQAGLEQEVE